MATQAAIQAATQALPPVTQTLAQRACSLRYNDLPPEVVELARQCLLDLLAVSLPGAAHPGTQLLRLDQEQQGMGRGAAFIGGGEGSARQAALVNGYAAHALDFDDVNLVMGGHASAVILPALLAVAHEQGATGEELLTAFVAGYELACRVGILVGSGHYARGYHATSTVGSLGAVAACCHVLGLETEMTQHALGIMATQAAGLKGMFGTPCKPLHCATAAHNAVAAVAWARAGLRSRTDSLECVQGFARTMSPECNAEKALDDPAKFHIHQNLFKYHAACLGTQSAIECALDLAARHRLRVSDIAGVTVRVARYADGTCNIAWPSSSEEAKFSLRFATALALSGGDTGDIRYGEHEDQFRSLAEVGQRIAVELMDDGRPVMDTDLEIRCANGAVVTARTDVGVPETDLIRQRGRLEAKFMKLTAPVLGEPGAQLLASALEDVARQPVRRLMALAVPDARA